ncbi:MAG: DinB family protein [Chloroflexota bacterium]|nr:DinB family protein [Chloroflexota bacterium]
MSHTGIRQWVDEVYKALEEAIAQATPEDMAFVPHDPAATADEERGWTIPHVIAHLTATEEEAASHAASLARGVVPEGRSRYEVEWEQLTTPAQVRQRLAESERMVCGYLAAWPDSPHLDVTFTPIPPLGPLNAITRLALGTVHTENHLAQIREILRQRQSAG